MVTLSVYTHLFEGALGSVMERLDDEHRSLARPNRDPNVIELGHRQRTKGGQPGMFFVVEDGVDPSTSGFSDR